MFSWNYSLGTKTGSDFFFFLVEMLLKFLNKKRAGNGNMSNGNLHTH